MTDITFTQKFPSGALDEYNPVVRKTGTTILGLIYKDGVVLAADKRATVGTVVFEKACEKIHFISENISACGAGVAADTEKLTLSISRKMKRMESKINFSPRVTTAVNIASKHLFERVGVIQAALIFGGVDDQGAQLFAVSPHGYTMTFPFLTMGSGCLAALGVLEAFYKEDMDREEAMQLAHMAVKAGAEHDLGSGYNIDVKFIEKDSGRASGVVSGLVKASGEYLHTKGLEKLYLDGRVDKELEEGVRVVKKELVGREGEDYEEEAKTAIMNLFL